MGLVNANDENSFDPTPKLKSSPIPILFVPFNKWDENCFHCGNEYAETLYLYCETRLSRYITEIDMSIYTTNLEFSNHEMRDKELFIQNIQEWCENCSGVSHFKQISTYYLNYSRHYDDKNKVFESENYAENTYSVGQKKSEFF